MKKIFAIACGGTGGHLSPGIALAQVLSEHGHHCILIISKKSIDRKICEAYPDFQVIALPGTGWVKNLASWPRFIFLSLKNFFHSILLLRKMHVNAVVGFGGFTNIGVIISAFLLKKPCFLHEANQIIGRTIHWLSPLTNRLYLPKGATNKPLFAKNIIACGFPLQKEMRKMDKKQAKRRLGIPSDAKLLIITGGSQGARILTQWAIEHAENLSKNNVHLICVTGSHNMPPESTLKNFSHTSTQIIFLPFSYQMSVLYSAADLVICRAGAGTLAELIRCEAPAIIVPYPYAAKQHQWANAVNFTKNGCGQMIEQRYLPMLMEMVLDFFSNPQKLKKIAFQLHQYNQNDSATFMANDIEQYLQMNLYH